MPVKFKKPRLRLSPQPRIVPGDAPGTLRPILDSQPATVTVITVTNGVCDKPKKITDFSKLPKVSESADVTHWVRVCGLGQVDPLRTICEHYGIKHLALEDILSPGWRSRLQQYNEYLFLVLQTLPDFTISARGDHLYLFCKKNLVISFEEKATPLIDSLWANLHLTPPAIKTDHYAGYLIYAALDNIVDSFFPALNDKDEQLALLEESIDTKTPDKEDLHKLHLIKRELLTLRRLITPYREICFALSHQSIVEEMQELRPYLNDLNDHVVQLDDLVDSYHEISKSLDDIYQSVLSNRMNDIMKTLTIISTIFMPLSFLAGLYGMNFDVTHPLNMPELGHPYGYPAILLTMLGVVLGMRWFFRKKKWL